MPDKSVDLVFTSPPYEDARTYGIDYRLKGDEWVEWCADRYIECCRVSKGLVAWVVNGVTRNFRWSLGPEKLQVELDRRGVHFRCSPIYHRIGISGSGGPDFWRNDYERILCSSRGKLPWSNNVAMGHPPKYPPGGPPSHRKKDGTRVKGNPYKPPALSNPGNVINCRAVGGGNIGSKLAHENEAPFPEYLAECFIRSFCPPGGTVLDPFMGSGTTLAVAKRWGRFSIGIDIRQNQLDLTTRRLEENQ